jgi:RHS repeat-associated protein
MNAVRIRPFAILLTIAITVCFFGSFLPSRTAQADAAAAAAPITNGAGGQGVLGMPQGLSNAPDVLGTVDLATGSARDTFPFLLEQGRGDAQAALALSYSSGHSVGFGGIGWTLDTPSIVRRGASGLPQFKDAVISSPTTLSSNTTADDYYFDGKLLVPICTVGGTACSNNANGAIESHDVFPTLVAGISISGWTYFRPEMDDSTRYFFSPDGRTWLAQTKAGHVLLFGHALDAAFPSGDGIETLDISTQTALGIGAVPYRWSLVRDSDASSNTVDYVWTDLHTAEGTNTHWDNGVRYLADIFDTPSIASGSTYAHHVHLSWQRRAGNFPDIASPIYRAQPALHLSTVDVTSAPWSGTTRQLVRRYLIGYANSVPWGTVDELRTISLQGVCTDGSGKNVATPEGSNGTLPASLTCPMLGGTAPLINFSYHVGENFTSPGPQLNLLQKFRVPLSLVRNNGCGPWAPESDCGGFSMIDMNADGAADFVWGPVRGENTGALANCFDITGNTPCPEGTICVAHGADELIDPSTCEIVGTPVTSYTGVSLYVDYSPPPSQITNVNEAGYQIYNPLHAPLSASISDLSPGSNHTVYGDWNADGHTDLLWMNISAGSSSAGSYESYTPYVAAPQPYPISATVGVTTGSLPTFGDNIGTPDWQTGRAIDLDGDGLVDQALVPYTPSGSGSQVAASYLTTRDRLGNTHPFQVRLNAGTYEPLDPGAYASNAGRYFADMDGDGLADVVIAYTTSPTSNLFIQVLTNRGNGAFGQDTVDAPVQSQYLLQGPSLPPSFLAFGDLNGDGLGDYAALNANGLTACIRSGVSPTNFACSSLTAAQLDWTGLLPTPSYIAIADIDGSGLPKILTWANTSATTSPPCPLGELNCSDTSKDSAIFNVVSLLDTGLVPDIIEHPHYLKTVTTSFGASHYFVYEYLNNIKSLTGVDPGKVEVPVWVVGGTGGSNGQPPINGQPGPNEVEENVSYTYQGPVYDPRDREFVGFTTISESHVGDAGAPGLVKKTTFATQQCLNGCSGTADYSQYRAMRGLPVLVEESGTDGVSTRTTENTYVWNPLYQGLDGRLVTLQSLEEQDVYLWDPISQGTHAVTLDYLNPSTITSELNTSISVNLPQTATLISDFSEWDEFGDLTAAVDTAPADGLVFRTQSWGRPNGDTTGWTRRLLTSQVGYVNSNAARTLGYDYDTVGRLTAVHAVLSGSRTLPAPASMARAAGQPADASHEGSTIYLIQGIQYDGLGNPFQFSGPDGRCQRVDYDTTFDQLPTTTYSYPQGCGSTNPMVSSMTFDRGFEKPTLELLPAQGGAVARENVVAYDSFGRVKEVDEPDPTMIGGVDPALLFDYSDTGPTRFTHVRTIGGPQSSSYFVDHYQYFDGYGVALATLDAQGLHGAAQQWTVSGAWSRFTNGLPKTQLKPFLYTGDPAQFASGAFYGTLTGPAMTYAYDGLGRLISTTDYLNQKTTLGYRLGSANVPSNAAIAVTVQDAAQQPAGSHNQASTTTYLDYLGRAVKSVAHLSSITGGAHYVTTTTAYLATGEPSVITRSEQAQTFTRWMLYDSLGRLVFNAEPNTSTNFSATPGAAGVGGWTYAYNDAGDVVGTSDARGCGENIAHDGVGRVTAEDFSRCDPAQPGYTLPDASGNGTEAFYSYDNYGQLHVAADLAQTTTNTYDGRGRLQKIDRQIATPTSPVSQFLATRYAPNDFTRSFTYDAANRELAATSGADASSLTTHGSEVDITYQVQGAIDTVSSSYGSLVTATTYDAAGSTIQRSFGDASHLVANYGYDANERLVNYGLSRSNGPWAASYTAMPWSSLDPNNTVQGVLTNLVACYDEVGNPIEVSESPSSTCVPSAATGSGAPAPVSSQWPMAAQPASHTYKYWDDYRIKDAATTYKGTSAPNDNFLSPYTAEGLSLNGIYPQPAAALTRVRDQQFAYDDLGNTTATTDDDNLFFDRSLGTVTNASGGNQVQSAVSANGNDHLQVTYDLAGNVQKVDVSHVSGILPHMVFNYTWDELGRLATANRTENGVLMVQDTFNYDWSGARVRTSQQVGTLGATTYSVDVFDSLVLHNALFFVDYVHDATTEHVYLNAGGELLGHAFVAQNSIPSASSGAVHMFMPLSDTIGSTSFVVDHDTGELVERPTYQAYGEAESDYRPSRWGSFRENIRYTGHEDNAEVGLSYFGKRYYATHLGRFLSPDPLAIHAAGGDLNPYAYVHGSPLRYADPFGLDGEDLTGDTIVFPDDYIYGYIEDLRFDDLTNDISEPDTSPGDPASLGANGGSGQGSLAQTAANFGLGATAFVYGALQGAAPGGIASTLAPLPQGAAQTRIFRYWQGAGQIVGGLSDLGSGVIGGGASIALEAPSFGTSTAGVVVSAGAVANGAIAIGTGWHQMMMAAAKGGGGVTTGGSGFTRSNFRANLTKLTGGAPAGAQAHHVFPQAFEDKFNQLGIDVHDPRYGAWWDANAHLANSAAYNATWRQFFSMNPTQSGAFALARTLAAQYGYAINF